MKKGSFITLLIAAILVIAGCGSNNEDKETKAEDQEEQDNDEETGEPSGEVDVNLYSGADRPDNLLDMEHEHYEPVEHANYDTINYVDENLFISAGSGSEHYSNAFALESGEPIWEEDILVNIDDFLEAPMYEDELYYTNDDERGKITYDIDSENNEPTEISDEEYDIRASEYVFEENSYIFDREAETLTSYDMDSLDEQWEIELDSFHSPMANVVETGDYVYIDTGDLIVYIVEKETGEIVFEEEEDESHYKTALHVDDTVYLLTVDGFLDEFFILNAVDTNTWEKEEVLSVENDQPHVGDTEYEELLYVNDRLVFMNEFNIYIINPDQHEVQNFYYYDDPETEDSTVNDTHVSAFIHDDQLYTLSDHDFHKSVHVIDIATGEVLQEYGFGDVGEFGSPSSMGFMDREDHKKIIEKINDDSFVILTRYDGIYEFNFSDVNK